MEMLNTKSNTKSRKGCSECKRKRVKCDEAKPVCSRCQRSKHADLCDYNLKLSWTQGRPFKKRRLDITEVPSGEESSTSFAIYDHDHDTARPSPRGQSASEDITPAQSSAHRVVDPVENDVLEVQLAKRPSVAATTPVTGYQSTIKPSIPRKSKSVSHVSQVPKFMTHSRHSSYHGGHNQRLLHRTPLQLGDAPDESFDDQSSSTNSFSQFEDAPQDGCHNQRSLQHSPSQFEDAPDDDSLHSDVGATTDTFVDDETEGLELVRSSHSPSVNIPQSLSTYPLLCPSESPNAYFFLHHYSIHTATTLFPLLPAASRDSVLSVAATSPNLLSALLAISAAQYGKLRGDSDPDIQNRAAFFSRKALSGLQKAMADPAEATTFPTICTVLALCTNDVLMSGNVQGWKTHLRGAEQLLTLAIGESRQSATVTDPAKLFLVKWFAALDLFAGMSSLTKTLVPDGRYWSIGCSSTSFTEDGSGSTAQRQHVVDDLVGFSLELMPILSRISRMARLQQRKTSLALSSSLGAEYYTEVAEDLDALLADNVQHTESQLHSLITRVSSPPVSADNAAFPALLPEETQDTHRLFVYSALLHLYRRVQELPKDHAKPEYATLKIIEIINRLRPDSPASIVILWPLFSAGCETDDPVRREIIKARMVDLRRYGMGNVDQALVAMQEYWQSDTEERWDVFLGNKGVDLVLF